ncbi:uncharacterized protein LOC115314421 [Ixodes scapularis]|uniref:uncharacterized protein LOC115314421 n=1 Tax=Ixodes scapularis TaxID=6945 RepID=UPI001C38B82F|nr:uncharacterized protein LOC115314421 [Ixodes scapularis]
MEKRCRIEIKQGTCNGASGSGNPLEPCESCATLEEENRSMRARIQLLEEENSRVKATLDYLTAQRDGIEELANSVSDVRLLHEELREMGKARNAEITERRAEVCNSFLHLM